ncbi:hypothetical protein ACFPVX_21235 [Cohnella faecalis]|uniref:DUF948 domain-containing protein n=1 Tax=Cohnella faecalis TaxID=2315694 RepID=A0A398CQG7_9BACL|nr:hypothetical protein [Cohnella faecalis]RIE03038.1 hypothetical protein D3H35_20830 [Cohnella faecalis]
MAWDVAAYAIALAAIVIAAAVAIGAAAAHRSLRRLEKTAQRLEINAAEALAECREFAFEARTAAASCKAGLQGFQTLAEGARALGTAAGNAAHTATRLTAAWHDRLRPNEAAASKQADSSGAESGSDWLELRGFVQRFLRGRISGLHAESSGSNQAPRSSAANADATQGE